MGQLYVDPRLGVAISTLLILCLLSLPLGAGHGPTLEITADTVLTADLTGHIIIAADGITLDCNGHVVMGDGDGTGFLLDGRTGVTVKNCHVTQFRHGINLVSSPGNTL